MQISVFLRDHTKKENNLDVNISVLAKPLKIQEHLDVNISVFMWSTMYMYKQKVCICISFFSLKQLFKIQLWLGGGRCEACTRLIVCCSCC